jgi:tripartite-type tricarboxylate transporter receptor subunit TctC
LNKEAFGMRRASLAAALLGVALSTGGANAQPDFYRDKQIRMIVGHPVGGDYDAGGRLLAKHLPKHIPGNPTVIVQNMPAAGSIVAGNFLYNQAPRDGTVFGSFSRNYANQALMGNTRVEIDPRRFNYLGATSLPSRVCVGWHTAKVKALDELFKQELIVAGASLGASLSIVPTVLNHVIKTRFRIIEGYTGISDSMIAIERGEVEGVCTSYGQFRSHQKHIEEGRLRVLLRAEEAPMAELPDVPSIYPFAKTEEQRHFLRFVLSTTEFGRPYVLPPETPKDRVDILRNAIAAAVKDPELVAEANKMRLDMTYQPPAHLAQLVAKLYATPPATIAEIKKLIPNLQ